MNDRQVALFKSRSFAAPPEYPDRRPVHDLGLDGGTASSGSSSSSAYDARPIVQGLSLRAAVGPRRRPRVGPPPLRRRSEGTAGVVAASAAATAAAAVVAPGKKIDHES